MCVKLGHCVQVHFVIFITSLKPKVFQFEQITMPFLETWSVLSRQSFVLQSSHLFTFQTLVITFMNIKMHAKKQYIHFQKSNVTKIFYRFIYLTLKSLTLHVKKKKNMKHNWSSNAYTLWHISIVCKDFEVLHKSWIFNNLIN